MDNSEHFFSESKQKIEEYVQDRLLLIKLDAVEKGSKLIATIFSIFVIALFSFLVLIFLSIMAGYLFGELLHHLFWGFGIVAGFYIILLLLIIVYRKKIIEKRLIDVIISIVFEKANEELKEETNEQ
jgi:energy-coupling factor transporter transmembrane protein EcfT